MEAQLHLKGFLHPSNQFFQIVTQLSSQCFLCFLPKDMMLSKEVALKRNMDQNRS